MNKPTQASVKNNKQFYIVIEKHYIQDMLLLSMRLTYSIFINKKIKIVNITIPFFYVCKFFVFILCIYFFVYLFNTNIKKYSKMSYYYKCDEYIFLLYFSINIAASKHNITLNACHSYQSHDVYTNQTFVRQVYMMIFIIYNAIYIDRPETWLLWRSRNSIGKWESRDLFDIF